VSDRCLCSPRDYKEYHTDTTVKFVIQMSKEALRKAEAEGLHKVFKLQTLLSINSMVGNKCSCMLAFGTTYLRCGDCFSLTKSHK